MANQFSVLVPLVAALCTFVEDGHWFVGASDLYLLEVGAIVRARVAIFALGFCIVHVLPSVITSKDIVDFFTLEMHFVLELTLHAEYVGAGLAEKSEVRKGFFGQKDVGAGGAEKHGRIYFFSLFLRLKVNFTAVCGSQ